MLLLCCFRDVPFHPSDMICKYNLTQVWNTVHTGRDETTQNRHDTNTVWRWFHIHIRKTEKVSGRRTVPRHAKAQKEHKTDQRDEVTWPYDRQCSSGGHTKHIMLEWSIFWYKKCSHEIHIDTRSDTQEQKDLDASSKWTYCAVFLFLVATSQMWWVEYVVGNHMREVLYRAFGKIVPNYFSRLLFAPYPNFLILIT